jgi:hypothetical protein
MVMMISPALVAGCGEGSRNPLAPSAVAGAHSGVAPIAGPGSSGSAFRKLDVNFPPRNESLDFRRALEDTYRDSLNRAPTSTFVDLEGAVVWVQEYLRYRVNLCSHAEAAARVMSQIDGGGIAPVCGSTTNMDFPPRNESLEFMQLLEAKYQNGLRRTPIATYVDMIGNVVWTQEYLRYRAGLCTSHESVQKIHTQIYGGGVPLDCRPGAGINGYWDGTYADGAPFTMEFSGAAGAQARGTADGFFLRVQSLGNAFTFTANYFNLTGEWNATWNGFDVMTGTATGVLTHPGGFTARRRR